MGTSWSPRPTVRRLLLIDLMKGAVVRTFSCPGTLFTAALSPDEGKHLAAGGVRLRQGRRVGSPARWEGGDGPRGNRLSISKGGGIRSVAYSPDGRSLRRRRRG